MRPISIFTAISTGPAGGKPVSRWAVLGACAAAAASGGCYTLTGSNLSIGTCYYREPIFGTTLGRPVPPGSTTCPATPDAGATSAPAASLIQNYDGTVTGGSGGSGGSGGGGYTPPT